MRLKYVTNDSWVIIPEKPEESSGLITKTDNKYTLLSKGKYIKFNNKSEIKEHFRSDVFKNIEQKLKNVENFISGYPINCTKPYGIKIENDIPLFSKTEKLIPRCAGYYVLLSGDIWKKCFCPKYSSLIKSKYHGPFRTEEEANKVLSEMRVKKIPNTTFYDIFDK